MRAQLIDVTPDFDTDIRLIAEQKVAIYRGEEIPLSSAEYLILQCTLLAPDEVLTKDDLFDHLWGDEEPTIRRPVYR